MDLALPPEPFEVLLREVSSFLQQFAQAPNVVLIPFPLDQIHVCDVEKSASLSLPRFRTVAMLLRFLQRCRSTRRFVCCYRSLERRLLGLSIRATSLRQTDQSAHHKAHHHRGGKPKGNPIACNKSSGPVRRRRRCCLDRFVAEESPQIIAEIGCT